jgi:hypothetical protein
MALDTCFFGNLSPQIRLICLQPRTFLDMYNNKSCTKYRLEHCVKIASQSEDFEELWPLTLVFFLQLVSKNMAYMFKTTHISR